MSCSETGVSISARSGHFKTVPLRPSWSACSHGATAAVRSVASRTICSAPDPVFSETTSSGFTWRPANSVAVPDAAGEQLIKLIETLDDHDDVQNVYGNYELSDALMAKLGG